MLERLTFAPASDKIAQWRKFCFVKSALEFQIKFHARAVERVCKQMLRIQARILDPSFFKIRSRWLQYIEHGHVHSFVIPSESVALSEVEWVEESLTVIWSTCD